jgi:hypothetical protein
MKTSTLLFTGLLVFSSTTFAAEPASPERLKEVQQHTQHATPYDINQTEQMFNKTAHGGVQHIVVKDKNNTEQIKLVQAYLIKMSADFSKGDFSDTEKMHGANMPGLARLKMAEPYDIKFEYKALPDGGQVHYSSEYPQYAQALHEWIDAQIKDHNSTVIDEHSQHHATPAQ